MTTQTVTYCTSKCLPCGTLAPIDVFLCVPTTLVLPHTCPVTEAEQTTAYGYIEATLTACAKNGTLCGSQTYSYTFEYDDAQLIADTLLTGVQIFGVVCHDCGVNWILQAIGDEPYIRTEEDGSQVFVSPHGCEYPIEGDFSLNCWATDEEGNFYQEEGCTGSIIFDTLGNVVAPDGFNFNVGDVDRFQIGASSFTWNNSSGNEILTLGDTGILSFLNGAGRIIYDNTDFIICADTPDGADVRIFTLAGGGFPGDVTRGANLVLAGNENGNGRATLSCGDFSGSSVAINAPLDANFVTLNIGTGLPEHMRFDTTALFTNKRAGFESVAGGSALLGANCPAVTVGAPFTWITLKTSDGSTVFMPVWK